MQLALPSNKHTLKPKQKGRHIEGAFSNKFSLTKTLINWFKFQLDFFQIVNLANIYPDTW